MTPPGWFLQSGTRRFGPMTEVEMRANFRAGMVKGNDIVHAPDREAPLTATEAADELGMPAPPPQPIAPTPYEPRRKPATETATPAVAVPIGASVAVPEATTSSAPASSVPPPNTPLVPPPPTAGFKVTERGPDSRWPVVLWIAVLSGLHLVLVPQLFPARAASMSGFAAVSFIACALVAAVVFFGFARLAVAMRSRAPRVHVALAALTLAYLGFGARHLFFDSTLDPSGQRVEVRAGIIAWDRAAEEFADRKDYTGLLAHANRWLHERENHYLALYWRGQALGELGRWTEAVRDYESITKTRPNEAWGWFLLGLARVETQDNAGAVDAYRHGLDIDGTSVIAWNNLGYAYGHMGKIEDQVFAYERAVKLDPDYVMGWANLARAYARQGRREKSEEARARAEALGGS